MTNGQMLILAIGGFGVLELGLQIYGASKEREAKLQSNPSYISMKKEEARLRAEETKIRVDGELKKQQHEHEHEQKMLKMKQDHERTLPPEYWTAKANSEVVEAIKETKVYISRTLETNFDKQNQKINDVITALHDVEEAVDDLEIQFPVEDLMDTLEEISDGVNGVEVKRL